MAARSAVVILLAIPGALAAMWIGVMAAAFSGAGPVTSASQLCWLFWGAFGGACFGALPGLLVGLLLGVRWVIPMLDGAIGAIPGIVEANGVHVLGGTNLGGFLAANCVVAGVGVGAAVWHFTNPIRRRGAKLPSR